MIDSSSKITYTASGFSAFWGLFTTEQWIGIAGVVIGLLGLAIKTTLEIREERRRQERHEVYLANNAEPAPKIETDI